MQDKNRLISSLALLQRLMPIAIIVSVLVYEVTFEVLLHEWIGVWPRIALEITVFGFAGAGVVWLALEWVRRQLLHQAAREESARRQEQLLATITSNSADAITLLDNEGCFRSWNHGAELLFGYNSAEVIGQPYTVIVPTERRGELKQIDAELDKNGVVHNWITQRVTKDGRVLTVELTRTLLHDKDGQRIGSSAIIRDVTERERAQNEIRQLNRQLETQVAQRTGELSEANRELRKRQRELEMANDELKELDQLKSEFVSLVSHELRAPLANISGSLELLLAEPSDLTDNQRDLLTLTSEQVARLSRLVRGILNVSRIEAGQTVLQPQAFDLADLLTRALSQWQTCDPARVYRVVVSPNSPSVWADRDRVEEVLTNLLENAFKYSDEGTEITVEARVADDYMIVSVSDQGEGISPQDLERIFDKFYRVERDDARRTYGYGLGLYISFKLIEEMGGRLWAESEVKRGSRFYFSLPLAGHVKSPRAAPMPTPALAHA